MLSRPVDYERENQQLHEQLDAAQKALQDFVYVVSHDLGTPLRAVTGFSNILQNKYNDRLDEKGQTYLNFIADGGAKAQQMLAGLLQYSRVYTQVKPFHPTDLSVVLDFVFAELKEKIIDRTALINYGTMPTVMVDADQIGQLFFAVINNALTYQHQGVMPQIQIEAEEMEDFWKISIIDNGIGVAEENCERVFQIFRRLHPDGIYPGIGMGLAIAQRIVQRHGGEMGLKSRLHYGATCWFTLPKVKAQNDVATKNAEDLRVERSL